MSAGGISAAHRRRTMAMCEGSELEPTSIDRYELIEALGKGNGGSVFRARNKVLGNEVALKIMQAGTEPSEVLIDRFWREAKALNLLKHEYLVSLLDFGVTGDRKYFLVLEYLPGRTLASVLEGGAQLEPVAAAKIARQIALGLEHLHGQGMIHRDLKPANIMLTPDESGELKVKIVDFGLVGFADDDARTRFTPPGMIMGTPTYIAPERISGQHGDARTDLYALGVILYQALAGHVPFAGDLRQVLSGHMILPPPLVYGGGPLAELAQRLMAKDPNDRPASARAVIEALDAFLNKDPLDAWFHKDDEFEIVDAELEMVHELAEKPVEVVPVPKARQTPSLLARISLIRKRSLLPAAAIMACAAVGIAIGGTVAVAGMQVRAPLSSNSYSHYSSYPVTDYADLPKSPEAWVQLTDRSNDNLRRVR